MQSAEESPLCTQSAFVGYRTGVNPEDARASMAPPLRAKLDGRQTPHLYFLDLSVSSPEKH
jgi:hypothetical protein